MYIHGSNDFKCFKLSKIVKYMYMISGNLLEIENHPPPRSRHQESQSKIRNFLRIKNIKGIMALTI